MWARLGPLVTAIATESSTLWWPQRWGPGPRWATRRSPDRETRGAAVGAVGAAINGPLFPFQQFIVDVACEVDGDGSWAYDQVVILGQRRIGKTYLLKSVVAERGARGFCRMAITAQTRDKAKDRWADIAIAPGVGLAASRLARNLRATHGVGNEVLRFETTGAIFSPFAPNENASHGDEIHTVFVDELWALSLGQRDAIRAGYEAQWSIMAGQEWLLSAAGTSRSLWLREERRRGRAATLDPGSRTAYFEFGPPEVMGDGTRLQDLDDEVLLAVVEAAHPRRGTGLRRSFLEGQLARGRAEFLRRYANVDADDDGAGLLPADVVRDARVAAGSIPRGVRLSVGVAVDDDRRESTVAAAWSDGSGPVLVETLSSSAGSRWPIDFVAALEHVGVVAVENRGHGRTIADELTMRGVEVSRVSAADVMAADAAWVSDLTERRDGVAGVRHDGAPALLRAIAAAALPPGRQMMSATGEPFTAARAHALALWGWRRIPPVPTPPPRFRIF